MSLVCFAFDGNIQGMFLSLSHQPMSFSSYFLLLLCCGGGVKDWLSGGMRASQGQPSREGLPASIVRPLSSCQECDRALQSCFMLLIRTTEPWDCWKGNSVVGATGPDVSVLVHWSDTATKESANEGQSKAGRDASPVQSYPSWNTKDISYSFIWPSFHWRKPKANDPHCLWWLGYLVTYLNHMDDGLQFQQYLSLFENISTVFKSRNTHTINKITA